MIDDIFWDELMLLLLCTWMDWLNGNFRVAEIVLAVAKLDFITGFPCEMRGELFMPIETEERYVVSLR